MSEESLQPLTITVGDQSFRIRVAPEEHERYLRVAQVAGSVLQDVLDGGVVGGPRAYAMALFQLAVELAEARQALRGVQQDQARLGELIRRIERAMSVDSGKR